MLVISSSCRQIADDGGRTEQLPLPPGHQPALATLAAVDAGMRLTALLAAAEVEAATAAAAAGRRRRCRRGVGKHPRLPFKSSLPRSPSSFVRGRFRNAEENSIGLGRQPPPRRTHAARAPSSRRRRLRRRRRRSHWGRGGASVRSLERLLADPLLRP
jgi:hypothetical protein